MSSCFSKKKYHKCYSSFSRALQCTPLQIQGGPLNMMDERERRKVVSNIGNHIFFKEICVCLNWFSVIIPPTQTPPTHQPNPTKPTQPNPNHNPPAYCGSYLQSLILKKNYPWVLLSLSEKRKIARIAFLRREVSFLPLKVSQSSSCTRQTSHGTVSSQENPE